MATRKILDLESLFEDCWGKTAVATTLNVSRSTVYRAIANNSIQSEHLTTLMDWFPGLDLNNYIIEETAEDDVQRGN